MGVSKMKSYCSKCNKLSEASIQNIDEVFAVRGEKISIRSEVAICNACGNKIFNQQLDDKNLSLAYSIYRKTHNLLSPSEIADIRKKYSLSQRSLARLLEWGEVTINRYENGAVQDAVHNEVLMFISEPRNMKGLFEKNNQFLSKAVREKLEKRVEELIKNELKPKLRISLLEDFISCKVDEYSGFANFDLEKMINMILYIAEKTKGVFTTKLNKLLWYADFLNFKEYSISISGSNYVHLPLGPVPDDYEWIIAAAIDEGLDEEEIAFSSGYTGTQYKALVPVDQSLFSKEEIRIIDFVIEHFKDYTGEKIKEKSHDEKAYKETVDNEKISYRYASSLSLSLNNR